MRTARTPLAATLALVLTAGAAAAQSAPATPATPAALGTPTRTVVLTPVVVRAAADEELFDLDDALLAGLTLDEEQTERVTSLRRMQLAAMEAARPRLTGALIALRRAQERGDEVSMGALVSVLQLNAEQGRTWRLAVLRALLTPEQQRRFDENAAALERRGGD